MVRPTNFCTNYESIKDNKFMNESTDKLSNAKAQEEFDNFVSNLKREDVSVEIYDQPCPEASDAIFPNNWISTHRNKHIPEGLLIIYPMKSFSRRIERNPLIIEKLKKIYKNFIDLTYLENENEFLESTGSLVFDNLNRRVYCSMSERATKKALNVFIDSFNKFSEKPYELITFTSSDMENNCIYHTNVMLSILDKHAVICLEVIKNEEEKQKIKENLGLNRDIIELSYDEMKNFGCNILNVKNTKNQNVLIISNQSVETLNQRNIEVLRLNYILCSNEIKTIEFIGGGSARCMVMEIF